MFAELSLINNGGTLSLYIDNKKIVVEKENVPSFIAHWFTPVEAKEWCKPRNGGRIIPLYINRRKEITDYDSN